MPPHLLVRDKGRATRGMTGVQQYSLADGLLGTVTRWHRLVVLTHVGAEIVQGSEPEHCSLPELRKESTPNIRANLLSLCIS